MWEASVHNYLKIWKTWVSLSSGYCLGGLQFLKAVWLRVNFLRGKLCASRSTHSLRLSPSIGDQVSFLEHRWVQAVVLFPLVHMLALWHWWHHITTAVHTRFWQE